MIMILKGPCWSGRTSGPRAPKNDPRASTYSLCAICGTLFFPVCGKATPCQPGRLWQYARAQLQKAA